MGVDLIFPSFSVGELAPDLFGRVDLQAFHRGAGTMRNMFVNYKGGSSSRPGTAFVGRCLQSGTDSAPRDIPFRYTPDENYVLEFGNQYMRVKYQGAYILEAAFSVTAATQANPCVLTIPGHNFSPDDWFFVDNILGMIELNKRTYIVRSVSGDDIIFENILGTPVKSLDYTAYSSGGTAARLFTLTTPYLSSELQALKYSQEPSVMTLTHRSHRPRQLTRIASNDWSLDVITFATSISPPTGTITSASSTTSSFPTAYSYVVTAIDAKTGEESVASASTGVTNSVNINSVLGSLAISWATRTGADSYNIYKAPASLNGTVPVGVLYGYIGTALGLSFIDSNIIADFSTTPPLHINPFATSSITSVTVTAGGSGYTSSPTLTVNTSTGSGAALVPVIVSGALASVIIVNGGENYSAGDTITVSGGAGSGATATLALGPSSGTYPGVIAYFQQRRVFANTTNEPDTYWMSKTGAYSNFDSGQIPQADDALSGAPWAQQINGIQFLVPMPGGLVILTGLGAWQLSGGASSAPVTPADQNAQPQAGNNGCHQYIPPIVINYDILYVQSKGSIVRALSYNLWANIYAGTDVSILSSHLFEGRQLVQWAWAEEPYKIVWAIRDDGTLLSLTYLKEQEIQGWSRHDTNGLFVSICSVSEPPVDAVYLIAKRYVNGAWYYFSERMNNRLWNTIEDCWCVDCGLALAQPTPAANIVASSSTGPSSLLSVDVILGGSGYTDPILTVIDPTGSGASLTATVVAGVITAVTVVNAGSGYTAPQMKVSDSTGKGVAFSFNISNRITIQADADVFSSGDVGSIMRLGGGIGEVVTFISSQIVTVNLTLPITATIPNDPDKTPLPVAVSDWTLTVPVTELNNLEQLEGKTVSVLADGGVIQDLVVTNGMATLPIAASSIVIGLPFIAQLQSLYVDVPGDQTIQGKRKDIYQAGVRVKFSRGIKIGSNQIDASTQQNQANVPWTGLTEVRDRGNALNAGLAIPLWTGDYIQNIKPAWNKHGQVAIQQDYPLPMNILAIMPDVEVGDTNG